MILSRRTALVGSCASLFALASLSAQNTIVSPVGAASADGNGQNAWPWLPNNSTPSSAVNVHRYMQIHSDLGNTPKVITKIAFRRNGASATQNGTRAIDMELWMGSAVDYAHCSWVYANNWVMPPTQVLTRQVVNIGPLAAVGNPAPFEIAIPLVTPYVHIGVWSLGWDARIHRNAETPPLVTLLDAEASSTAFGMAPASTGSGCIAAGRTSPMSLVLTHHDSAGTYLFGGYVDNAPASAPVFLALGTNNPNLAVPGLCGNAYTDLAVVVMLGTSDAAGFLGVKSRVGANVTKGGGGPFAFAFANLFAGQRLYLQAHAIDAASTWPLQIANSEGRSLVIPTPITTKVVRCSRLFHTDAAPGDPWSTFDGPPSLSARAEPVTLGYALVTEFTY